MAEESKLTINQQEGVTIVSFAEPNLLDAFHVTETAKDLYRLIEIDGCRLLVLDISSVSMLSSQSLGVFLNMRQKLEKLKGQMVISGIDPRLSRVFKITRLQDVFEFFDDTTAAVANLLAR
jgi:anti-sigma B factor antagonist